MRRSTFSILFFLLSVLPLSAADITGAWIAQVAGAGGKTSNVAFQFQYSSRGLIGSVTGPGGTGSMSNIRFNGDTVTFSVTRGAGAESVTYDYVGTVSGSQIDFKVTIQGLNLSRQLTATRSN